MFNQSRPVKLIKSLLKTKDSPKDSTGSLWRERIRSESLGKQWLVHFDFDIEHKNIPHDLLERFLKAVDEAAEKGIPEPTEDNPSPTLKMICNILNNPDHGFDLSGIRKPSDIEHCCRVMDVDAFSYFHAKTFCLQKLGAEVTENQLGDVLWTYFDQLTPKWYEGEFRSERPFFWVALKSRVDKIEECSADDKATTMRNCLGLDLGLNKRLVLIEIPQSLLVNKKVCAPTTLDAGAHKFFRPEDDPKGFGWTLHLETLERGAEELVIEKIDFTGECKVSKLGVVSTTVPEVEWDDASREFRKRANNHPHQLLGP